MNWKGIDISPFKQDVWDWQDPKTGEDYPPTFNWYAQLVSRRDDGVDFYVIMTLPKEFNSSEWTAEKRMTLLSHKLQECLYNLETYRNCVCKVGAPCDRHKKVPNELDSLSSPQ